MTTGDMIAGVDEAGRGCLAGPVVAAAVILTEAVDCDLLMDSKQLSEKRRLLAFEHLYATTPYIGIGIIQPREIDDLNILNASMKAMAQAIAGLSETPTKILVDGNKTPTIGSDIPIEAIVKGDGKIPAISAASIIAKVSRDKLMNTLHEAFPMYQLHQNKGYGSEQHYDAIFEHGPSPIHRHSFNLTRQQRLF